MGRRPRPSSQSPLNSTKRDHRWLFVVTHVLVNVSRGCFVDARLWRDIVSEEDMLRGSKSKKEIQESRPGELTFGTEENPFYFPSSGNYDGVYSDDRISAISQAEQDKEVPATPDAIRSDTVLPISGGTSNSNWETSQAGNSNTDTNTNLEHDNIFERRPLSPATASARDIRSYRTTRTFVPPSESPGPTVVSSSSSNENPPQESSSTKPSSYDYLENSALPTGTLPKGYFNYDTSIDSWYGPGNPVFTNRNDELVVEYINNAWMNYQPPPPISPSDAMLIANGQTDKSEYFYWDEFGPEGLGFGTWVDTLNNVRDAPNQCGNVGKQSPIDIRPNGYACLEHHQIRSRRGDFKVFGRRNSFELSILPSKLRVGVRRRPCKYLENPVCSEPDPPHADFPHGWPGFVDVLHIDFKFPAEHTLNGKKFDGEMQIYHLHPGRKRLPVVSVLMEVVEDDSDKDAGYNDHLQEAIDGFQYEYDFNRANCANPANQYQNRRLRERNPKLLNHNSTFLVAKDNHRRRLARIWDPYHESLVPSIYFYGYDGSLTEPPCTEIVSWFVIDETMKISRNQLEQMKYLLFTNVDGSTCRSTSTHYQSSVARPIQETGPNRPIWHCTSDHYLPDV